MSRTLLTMAAFLGMATAVGGQNPYPPVDPYGRNQPAVNEATVFANELARLQGTWGLVHEERDGQLMQGRNMHDQLVIQGDKFVRTVNGRFLGAGNLIVQDPYGPLKRMDLILTQGPGGGGRFPAVYVADESGFRYTFNYHSQHYPDRLETFPGDGYQSLVFQRLRR